MDRASVLDFGMEHQERKKIREPALIDAMFFSDMSLTVKEAGFRPVMVEGELADKAKEKK
jgi:hypothetical protein